jgi:hypothetical protein
MSRISPRPIAGARHRRFDPVHFIHRLNIQPFVQARTIFHLGTRHAPPPRPWTPLPEHRLFVMLANKRIAAGERPCIQVVVTGLDGLRVRLVVTGLPGAIGHARTRRRAREIARTSVASILHSDPYAFDLTVDEA